MAQRRIVFIMEDLCFGGTQRQTLQLVQRLDRDRFKPVLLTLTGETDLDDEARASGIEVRHMGAGRKVDSLFFLRLLPKGSSSHGKNGSARLKARRYTRISYAVPFPHTRLRSRR